MRTIFSSYLFLERWMLYAFFSLLTARGCGSVLLAKVSVALILGHILYDTIKRKERLKILLVLCYCIAVFLQWPISFLWGFWALLIINIYDIKSSKCLGITSGLFGLWLLQEWGIGSWTALPYISPIVFLGISVIGALLGIRFLLLLMTVCFLLTAYQVFDIVVKHPRVEISQDSKVVPSYSPGPLLAKILEGNVVKPGAVAGDIGISSIIFDKGPYLSSRHILLAEHDIDVDSQDPILRVANAQQLEPWFANQMFGNQYLLEAVARDGYWMCNLGGSLMPKGRLLLGSLSHQGDQYCTPLVIQYNQFVYVQDSDSFVDRIVNRQENIVKEISIGRAVPRILNLCFCILSIAVCIPGGAQVVVVSLLVILGYLDLPKSGDVRIVARLDWPHEPSKASGVMASLVDHGFVYRLGDVDTRILVVGKGQSTFALASERLILLEPGSSVRVSGHIIRASEIPIGTWNGIVDCRNLYFEDQEQGPEVVIKGVRILGTGSPAKINWNKWVES